MHIVASLQLIPLPFHTSFNIKLFKFHNCLLNCSNRYQKRTTADLIRKHNYKLDYVNHPKVNIGPLIPKTYEFFQWRQLPCTGPILKIVLELIENEKKRKKLQTVSRYKHRDAIYSLLKIRCSEEFIHWRLVICTHFGQEDYGLIGMNEQLEGASASVLRKWSGTNAKDKR